MRGRVHYFAEVVRRNICRHADRDAQRSVQKKIRYCGGQERWLFARSFIVRAPVDRLLLYVVQHLERDLRHLGFRVARCRRRVAIDRAEVPLSDDHGVAH